MTAKWLPIRSAEILLAVVDSFEEDADDIERDAYRQIRFGCLAISRMTSPYRRRVRRQPLSPPRVCSPT